MTHFPYRLIGICRYNLIYFPCENKKLHSLQGTKNQSNFQNAMLRRCLRPGPSVHTTQALATGRYPLLFLTRKLSTTKSKRIPDSQIENTIPQTNLVKHPFFIHPGFAQRETQIGT